MLHEGHCVPNTMDKIRKVVQDFGLSYEKIHACFNDCVLFCGEYEKLDKFPLCEESRWEHTNSEGTDDVKDGGVKKRRRFLVKFLGIFHLFPNSKDYI